MNPKILKEKVDVCTDKFRNVEGYRELVGHTERMLLDNSFHSVIESCDTVTIT